MPSKNKQLNVRINDESHARLAVLVERLSKQRGHEVSQAQVIQEALVLMERKHPPKKN